MPLTLTAQQFVDEPLPFGDAKDLGGGSESDTGYDTHPDRPHYVAHLVIGQKVHACFISQESGPAHDGAGEQGAEEGAGDAV